MAKVPAPTVHHATTAGVFVFFAALFILPSGYSYGAAVLLCVSLWYCLRTPQGFACVQGEDRLLLWVLLAYAGVMIVMTLWLDQPYRLMDKHVRALLAVPILLLLLRVPQRLHWLWSGIAAGVILSVWIVWQDMRLQHFDRAGVAMNSIHFGNIALVFSAFCVAGLIWAQTQQRHGWAWRALLVAGMGAGLYSSLMSGSRGGWVALPVVLVIFAVALLNRRTVLRTTLLFILMAALGFVWMARTDSMLHQRYAQAVQDIVQYQQRNADTSVGTRFELWRGAAMHLAQRPLRGWNMGDYEAALQTRVQEGRLHRVVLGNPHNVHNGYLQAWVFFGLPGLLVLLLMLGVPLYLFARRLRAADLGERALAVCGTTLTAAYACFNLTQAMFSHNNGIMFYLLALIILWAALRHARAAAAASASTSAQCRIVRADTDSPLPATRVCR